MKANFKNIIMLLFIVVAVIVAVSYFSSVIDKGESFGYSDVIELFEEDLVYSFSIDGNLEMKIYAYQPLLDEASRPIPGQFATDSNGNYVFSTYTYQIGYLLQVERIESIAYQKLNTPNSKLTRFDISPQAQAPWYQVYLPYIIVFVLFGVLYFFIMRQAPGGGGKINSFGKSKARVMTNDRDAVKFADVAGADEEKAELEEVVEFLRDPSKFVKLGARIPRGVLLVGPPGTGKTLLAKAVAGEAGVPFFSISGSDFVEMYVGVGASRVRDLFDNARKTNASIIFIDEIDAVGRHRGAGLGGGHDEREQTLNQLLVEMDGFGTNSGVIVMAATNRPDILDPALLRPGRFDRRITVNYPDMKGREAILKVHCRNKPLEATVDLEKIAQATIGFTGAELANLMNEAALLAAKKNKALIGMDDIEESHMKLLLGPQKKSKIRTEKDNRLCAFHEAGHAVASYYCKNTDPVKHITIIPAGNAGGVTISVPTEDRMTSSRGEMMDHIVLALGGRVAEELVLDDISTGASNDIQQATAIARNMVTRYGMSKKLGTVLYGSEHSSDEVFLGRDFSSGQNYSEKTAAEIDDEIRCIINEAYNTCKSHLETHIDKLNFVAEYLLKYESMDDEQFRAVMENDNPSIEEIAAIVDQRKKKSEEENKTAHENNEKARLEQEQKEKLEREKLEYTNRNFATDDFLNNIFAVPNDKADGDNDNSSDDGMTKEESEEENKNEEIDENGENN